VVLQLFNWQDKDYKYDKQEFEKYQRAAGALFTDTLKA
jgi:hypothetical protein